MLTRRKWSIKYKRSIDCKNHVDFHKSNIVNTVETNIVVLKNIIK